MRQFAAVEREERAEEPSGGVVVPLFRGRREDPEHPLRAFSEDRLTKREIAARLSVGERTVERWQKEAGLPHEKPFGPRGPVRYVWREVQAWWQARCHQSFAVGGGVCLMALEALGFL